MSYLTLLAQTDSTLPAWLDQLLRPERMALMVPILAIVGTFTVMVIRMVMHHRERIAKIQNGIDPDAPPEDR